MHIIAVSIIALIACSCTKKEPPLIGVRKDVIVSKIAVHVGNTEKVVIQEPKLVNDTKNVGTSNFSDNPKLLWKYKFHDLPINGNIMSSSPMIADGFVFFVDAGGVVHCLDANTGKRKWIATTTLKGESGQCGSAIAYKNGTLIVTSSFSECFSINASNGKIIWRKLLPSPCKGDGIFIDGDVLYLNCSGNTLQAINIKTGKIIWQHNGIDNLSDYIGRASPVVYGDLIVALYSSGEVVCLRKKDGYELWKTIVSNFSITDVSSTMPHLRANPVIDNGILYITSPNGITVAFDLINGNKLWSQEIGGLTPVNISGNYMFIVDQNSEIACLNKSNGNVVWLEKLHIEKRNGFFDKYFSNSEDSCKFVHHWHAQFITNNGLIHVSPFGDVIYSDYKNGKFVKSLKLSSDISVPPVISNGVMYLLSDDGYVSAYK